MYVSTNSFVSILAALHSSFKQIMALLIIPTKNGYYSPSGDALNIKYQTQHSVRSVYCFISALIHLTLHTSPVKQV